MMNKILQSIIAIIVAVSAVTIIPISVCALETSEFSISGAMITKYNGNADVVTVPAIIDGVEIAGIDSNAFLNKDMHSVVIKEGIEVIQPMAFAHCNNLEYVKSPESMLLINDNAFFECSPWLELDASDETYIMNNEMFSFFTDPVIESYNGFTYSGSSITGYIGEETALTIPDTINGVEITSIGASAFAGNTTITSVTIPDTVTTIGDYAFKGCASLTEVTLSTKLATAGVESFMDCISLEHITIPGTLKNIAKNMFYGCSNLTEAVLNTGVTTVGSYAFYNCVKLNNVKIPDTITRFYTWCFGFCKELKSIYIPNSCTNLDSATFYYCSSLNNINIPDSVTTIGTHCFRACSSLSNLTLPNFLKIIQYRSFNGCAFSEIKIPDSVTLIGAEAFYQCQKLINIEIPDAVKTIEAGAFYGCSALQKMIIYGTDAVLTDIFTYNGQTSMGANTVLYVVKDSVPEQYAKDSEIPYVSLSGTANVIDTYCQLNGSEHNSDTRTNLVANDSVVVKYTVVNVGNESQDLCLLICLYNASGDFLDCLHTADKIEINSIKEIEVSIMAESACYAKVMLWEDMVNVMPLCPINEI